MLNKVITMSDSNYFDYGKIFIKTRKNIDSDFILYGPDLNNKQIDILDKNNIKYEKIDAHDFKNKMQFLKFELIERNIQSDNGSGITFVDFDTFFLNDWSDIFTKKFDLGITFRRDMIKNKTWRAYSNGGVIFAKDTMGSKDFCRFAKEVMKAGGHKDLIEYDQIFKTLEENRPAHKTHKRENLRWWVDQCFLSCFVLRFLNQKNKLKDINFIEFNGFKIGLFDCEKYNHLTPSAEKIKKMKDKVKISHLKNVGRDKIDSFLKVV